MRQHVRTRQGLLLNEIGLLHSRRLEDVMKAVDSGPAASLGARAEAQRRSMEQGYKRAEKAFCRVRTEGRDATSWRIVTVPWPGYLSCVFMAG